VAIKMTDPSKGVSPPTGGAPLLEVKNLVAGYGDLRAVWDVSLTVHPGKTTVLLGSNGAGKSTTLLAIAGMARTMGGTVHYREQDMAGLPAYARTGRGLALVQEGKRIFRERTVEQNLRIGGWAISRQRGQKIKIAIESAYERFPVLAERRHHRAGSLSGGQQQILAIAQALIPEPSVLMLDEPSAGLAPIIMRVVLDAVEQLRSEGFGVLLVEQLVDAALSVADDVVVISRGRVALSGPVADCGDRTTILEAYLG
jgi:branched-chain amino acid transport system ATP-binding protein